MEALLRSRRPISGFIPVSVTPFNEAGEFVPEWYGEVLRWHLASGAEGLCVAAGNGEAAVLEHDELGAVVRVAVETAGSQVPIIAGAIGPDTITVKGTVRRVRAAMDSGARAVLVTPQPYLMNATRDEVISRYVEIYRQTRAPIVLYNSPRHFNINLDVELLRTLADQIEVVGLKEASREFAHITDVIMAHGKRFPVFVGPGWLIMPGVALGAAGFLSTGPDILGSDSAKIIPLASEKPSDENRRLHQRVSRIYNLLLGSGLGTSPSPLKAALNMMGVPAGVARAPVKRLTPESERKLRAGLEELGLLA